MAHQNNNIDLNERYEFSPKLKQTSFILIAVGAILFLAGAFISGNHTRIVADLLHNGIFFLLICLISVFFVSFNYLAQAGWSVAIKRVPEAISQLVPWFAGFVGVLMLYILYSNSHDIFHWLDKAHQDEILKGKSGYLNVPFMTLRILLYVGIWSFAAIMLRRYSMQEDLSPAGNLRYFRKSQWMAGFFILFFAVSISTSSWDWLMSIDPHWYSTMFGWYCFASALVSGISLIMLVIQYLRNQGYLRNVTDEHIHDIGKFMFAFSVLWTYLWYSQFMLIWYANMPEETTYFRFRLDHYKVLFFLNLIVNFATPLLVLMSNTAKRNSKTLIFIGCVIILGHWIDFYQMIMPGTIGENWNIGLMEIGLPIFFVGIIIFKTFTELTKVPLIPKNHPYIQESLHHHV